MEALIYCHVLHNILDARVGGQNFVINRSGVSNPINHSSKIFRHKSEWYNLAFLVFYSLIREFLIKLYKSLVTERRIIDPTRSQIVPMVSEDNINQALRDKRAAHLYPSAFGFRYHTFKALFHLKIKKKLSFRAAGFHPVQV